MIPISFVFKYFSCTCGNWSGTHSPFFSYICNSISPMCYLPYFVEQNKHHLSNGKIEVKLLKCRNASFFHEDQQKHQVYKVQRTNISQIHCVLSTLSYHMLKCMFEKQSSCHFCSHTFTWAIDCCFKYWIQVLNSSIVMWIAIKFYYINSTWSAYKNQLLVTMAWNSVTLWRGYPCRGP